MTGKDHASWYDRRVLPWLVDFTCGLKPIRRQRSRVVPSAHGRVLEIGMGTGLNLEHYEPGRVDRLTGLEPAAEMHHLARKRMQHAGLAVDFIGLSAEGIPEADETFDSVVVTYTLCTIPDPAAALREMRRVLKPDGQLIFCEHGLAPDDSVQRWQHRLTPYWMKVAGGCHLNRDIPALLAQTGFRATDMETGYLPGPRPLSYNFRGTARAV